MESGSSVRCLDEAIESSGIPRKVLADEGGISEAQFSRLVHSAAIEFIDKLPDDVVIDWVQRMGKQRAFEVQPLSPAEIDADVAALIDELAARLRVRKVRTRGQMKAEMRMGVPAARRVHG